MLCPDIGAFGRSRNLGFGNQYSIQLSYERIDAVQYSVFSNAPPAPESAIVYIMNFVNPDPEAICKLLRSVHTIAVVGLSPNPARPSFRVGQALQSFGYRIIPVRPLISEVLGEKAWPDLESLSELPDIVEVFRAPQHVPAIVESCIKLGVRNLWLQDGVIHEEAALHAKEAGIMVVMDRCMFRDYTRLCGRNP
jgi:predicted CoA-binding protein